MQRLKPMASYLARTIRGLSSGRSNESSGQSIVLIALMLVVLLGMAGLVFDGGTAYAERRRMQNGADAGALAGAQQLTKTGTTNHHVYSAINLMVNGNGSPRYGGQTIGFSANYISQGGSLGAAIQDVGNFVPSTAIGVQVVANTTFTTFFMGVLGNPTGAASAVGTATFGRISGASNGMLPFGPQCLVSNPQTLADCFTPGQFQFGVPINLWAGNGAGNLGWFGWDNTDPSASGSIASAQMQAANLCYSGEMYYTNPNNSSDHSIDIGDPVNGSSGVANGNASKTCMDTYIVGKSYLMPIWGTTNGLNGANAIYYIVGFAQFEVQSYYLPQSGGYITGIFVTADCPNCHHCTPGPGCPDFGVTTIYLSPPIIPTPTP